jgi:hypothetical protein
MPIHEAAVLLGMTKEGVRRRVLKGRLEGRKGNDGEWIVFVPDELAGTRQPAAPSDQELAALGARCQALELTAARLEERLAAADRLLTEREATILDLRQERDRLLERGLAAWLRRVLRIG